jgi:hypothetical protein
MPNEVNRMMQLYESVMGMWEFRDDDKFTLRVWDGMDGCWCDVVANVDLAFALKAWCERTADGTKATRYDHIDYYRIFPADVKMLWSGDFTMRGEDS